MLFLARAAIVGKPSEDPRSCWKEMTGAGTRRPPPPVTDGWAPVEKHPLPHMWACAAARTPRFRSVPDVKSLPSLPPDVYPDRKGVNTPAVGLTLAAKMAREQCAVRPVPMFGLESGFAALG